MALTNAFFDPSLNGGVAVARLVSLHSSAPNGSGSAEISGGGYERQSVTWASASGGSVQSGAPVVFNVPAGSTITHAGIWTESGTWLGSLQLAEPESFGAAGTLTVDPLTISLTN